MAPSTTWARVDLGHVGVDELGAGGPRCGEALVPVEHEVAVVQLEDLDWRNGSIRKGIPYGINSMQQMRSHRVEAAVEVAAATDGPADAVDRNLAQPDRCLRGEATTAAAEFVESDEIAASSLPDHPSGVSFLARIVAQL